MLKGLYGRPDVRILKRKKRHFPSVDFLLFLGIRSRHAWLQNAVEIGAPLGLGSETKWTKVQIFRFFSGRTEHRRRFVLGQNEGTYGPNKR